MPAALIDVSLSADDPAAKTVDVSPSTLVGMPAVSQWRQRVRAREALPPVMAPAAVEAHRGAVLDHLQAIALQRRLVDRTVLADGQTLGRQGTAGLDQASGVITPRL